MTQPTPPVPLLVKLLLAAVVALILWAMDVEIGFLLILGWIIYLARVVPSLSLNAAWAFTALICAAGTLLIGHALARWLWRKTHAGTNAPPPWRKRWTLNITAITLIIAIAGIAVIGVVHQTAWLTTSKLYGSESTYRVKCSANLHYIGQQIEMYAHRFNGNFPDKLERLLTQGLLKPADLICPSSPMEPSLAPDPQQQAAELYDRHCSYVYLGRGLKWPAPPDRPIACEFGVNHHFQGMNILYGDGSVGFEWPRRGNVDLLEIDASPGPATNP